MASEGDRWRRGGAAEIGAKRYRQEEAAVQRSQQSLPHRQRETRGGGMGFDQRQDLGHREKRWRKDQPPTNSISTQDARTRNGCEARGGKQQHGANPQQQFVEDRKGRGEKRSFSSASERKPLATAAVANVTIATLPGQDSKRMRSSPNPKEQKESAGKENSNVASSSGLVALSIDASDIRVASDGSPIGSSTGIELRQFRKVRRLPTNDLVGTARQEVAFLSLNEEIGRSRCLDRVRREHSAIIPSRIGLLPPKMSLNRWLVERQLCLKRNGKPSDPVLPALCEPVVSPSLLREILEDVPIKVNMYPKQLEQAKGSFIAYAQACIRVASDDSKGQVIPEDKKARIIAYCKQALEWVYEQQSCEEVMKRLVGMRRDCGKELQRKMRSTVEEVCAQIARCSEEQSKLLEGEIGKLREWVQANKGMSTERVLHKLVKVNNLSNGQIHVEVGGLHSQLQEEYYHKLEELYRHWLGSRGFSRSDFHIHLARMLLRYNSVCGYEGANLHAAVPTAVFEVLTREFGVQMECFASPLNCYYPQFCSAYPDTDQAFGSCGSFLEFNPTKGSFQANPPFTEEMLLAMTQHMERLLAAASEELSFIVIVSDWQDSEGVVAMMNSRFKRGDLVLEAREHGYLNGAQHTMPAVQRKCSTAHASRIVVLQNDAAFARWTPTTERLSALRIAFSQ